MMRDPGPDGPRGAQVAGAALNALKDEIDAACARKAALADARWTSGCASEWLDVTLPGRPRPRARSTRSAR
jgi:phenylalanyl-tRNA synthetase alpha chain